MALLHKLLKRQNSANISEIPSFKSYLTCTKNEHDRFVIGKNDVRLIIFKDHNRFGRKLLYDSQRCNEKEPVDKQLLGELMFGNQVMVRKAKSTIKVHLLKSPQQLFIAKVFTPNSNSGNDSFRSCETFDWYCFHDLPQNDLLASSNSLPVPLRDELNKSFDGCSPSSEAPYKAALARWWQMRNNDGSLENELTSSLAFPNTSNLSNKVFQEMQNPSELHCHELSNSCCSQMLTINQRPTKLGIGILFRTPEDDQASEFLMKFFFSHVVVLETHILKLKDILESPIFLDKLKKSKPDLLHSLFEESTGSVIQSLQNFYSFPRLSNPVWLALSLSSSQLSPHSPFSTMSNFMKDFIFLSEKCYTRNTKFFLGSLLTAVLTHHLSWASSPLSSSNSSHLNESVNRSNNPLLNQLSDLYGAVGFPCCISKTVVVGKKAELVKKILLILSYFIRSNDLFETTGNNNIDSINKERLTSNISESELFKDSGFCDYEAEDVHKNKSSNLFGRKKLKSLENLFRDSTHRNVENSKVSSSTFYISLNHDDIHDDDLHDGNDKQDKLRVSKSAKSINVFKNIEHCRIKSEMCVEVHTNNCEDKHNIELVSLAKAAPYKTDSCQPSNFNLTYVKESYSDNNFHSIIPAPKASNTQLCNSQPNKIISLSRCITPKTTKGSPEIKVDQSDSSESSESVSDSVHDLSSENKINLNKSQTFENSQLNSSQDLHKFDLEKVLFEVMMDIFKENDNGVVSRTSANVQNFKSSETPSDHCTDKCVTGCVHQIVTKNNCLLDVNEPTCLPDGPIKDQLLFKLDLIGTAVTAEDIFEKMELFNTDSNMKSSYETYSIRRQLIPLPVSFDLHVHQTVNGFCAPNEIRDRRNKEALLNTKQQRLLLDSNLSRSLLGDYCTEYTPEFVLHGTSDRSFLAPPYTALHQDLKASLKSSVLNEPADAALYIVADVDNWSVQLFSLKSISPDKTLNFQTIISSQLVLKLIESASELSKFNSSPHIWLSLVEDQLSNIYMKSRVLAEFIQVHGQLCSQQLARLLGYDVSDLPLLLAVAGIHSPRILPSLNNRQKIAE